VSKKHTQISDKLDDQILKALKKGVPLLDSKGHVVLDAKGKPLYGPPPAAYLREARQRLRDLRLSKVPRPDDSLLEMEDELSRREPQRPTTYPKLADLDDETRTA